MGDFDLRENRTEIAGGHSRISPLRVLHLRDTEFLCGPGKTILETVRRNRDDDIEYEVTAFGTVDSNDFLRQVTPYCHTFALPASRYALLGTALRLAKHVKRHRIHILHPHELKTRALAYLVGRVVGVPLITTLHGHFSVDRKSQLNNDLDKWLLRRMDLVFGVSRDTVSRLENIGVERRRIELVRNCIVTENYPFGYKADGMRKSVGLSEKDFVIGHVGRLSLEKGQRELLRVFSELQAIIPTARLVVAGDGPDRELLEAMAEGLGGEGAVRFVGYRKDIWDIFGVLDVLVLNSSTEGMPNVVLEAMALGVPVVATAVGGTTELVEDGETGLLVSLGDGRALGEAIRSVFSSPEQAASRAIAARKLIDREFDMSVLIEKTHKLYRNYLQERGCTETRSAIRE